MATTTNFGWETPDDTDLVKDGAAAMRTLGNSIDTSFVDLKGGTTGQVLSKASNTDLDYSWINLTGDIEGVTAGTGLSGGGTSGTVTLTNTMATAIDAKGDLVAGTGADTFSRLAVGANNTVLTADSTTGTGLKWATPSAAKNFSLLGTGTLTGASTITVSGISGMDEIFVVVRGASATSQSQIDFRINGDTGGNYDYRALRIRGDASWSATNVTTDGATGASRVTIGTMSSNAASVVSGYFNIKGCNTAGTKVYHFSASGTDASGNTQSAFSGGGLWTNSATVSSINLVVAGGFNFDAGDFLVYGAA